MKIRTLAQSTLAGALSITLVVLGLASGVALTTFFREHEAPVASSAHYPAPITLDPTLLTAKSAIVYDLLDGRILYAKNAEKQLPLASLTKLMTAQVVLSHTAPNTEVQITKKDLEPEGDWGLRVGDTVRLSDLLKFGLIASSNDAMAAAAASVSNYLDAMNDTANKLGLTKMYFLNPTGLDINVSEDAAGAYGSAYDVARLAATFFKNYPNYFTLTEKPAVSINSSGRTLSASATAAPLLNMPGFIGAKTGYTDLAGGNLVALVDVEVGHPLAFVVLGSTETGRFDDVRKLVDTIRTKN